MWQSFNGNQCFKKKLEVLKLASKSIFSKLLAFLKLNNSSSNLSNDSKTCVRVFTMSIKRGYKENS